jgi:hypothetical protein
MKEGEGTMTTWTGAILGVALVMAMANIGVAAVRTTSTTVCRPAATYSDDVVKQEVNGILLRQLRDLGARQIIRTELVARQDPDPTGNRICVTGTTYFE